MPEDFDFEGMPDEEFEDLADEIKLEREHERRFGSFHNAFYNKRPVEPIERLILSWDPLSIVEHRIYEQPVLQINVEGRYGGFSVFTVLN